MNTMDKQTIINLSNQFYNNQIPPNATQEVLNYCIERGKTPNLSQAFIEVSVQLGFFTTIYQSMLEYYQKQFEVCLIKNDLGKVIKVI